MYHQSHTQTYCMMRKAFLLLFCFVAAAAAFAKRTTVFLSLDGFRWDYTEMYHTPFLNQLGQQGVKAVMRPSFPSKTFPNHYTLATGLTPNSHGIIGNTFYDKASGLTFSLGNPQTKQDPRFWKGEPIWITAKRHGLRTATVYWPGSDVAIQGQHPDYWQDYERKPVLSFIARAAEIERLLQLPVAERPDLIMAYFEEPDHDGHEHGPVHFATRTTVEKMDQLLSQLYTAISTLPHADSINFVVTSDHGMTQMSAERFIDLSALLPAEWTERILYDIPVQVFPKKDCADKIVRALQRQPHLRVWKKENVPAYLAYGSNENIGEVVILPDLGWYVGKTPYRLQGAHGYDPTDGDMQVIFRAIGPDFQQAYVRRHTFSNTAIYPLLCRLLRIPPAPHEGREEAFDLLRP